MEMGVHVHAVVRCGCMSCVNARYLSGRLPTPPAAGAAGAGRVALTGRCRPAHAEQQRDAENTVRSGMRTTNPSFFLYFAQTSVVSRQSSPAVPTTALTKHTTRQLSNQTTVSPSTRTVLSTALDARPQGRFSPKPNRANPSRVQHGDMSPS